MWNGRRCRSFCYYSRKEFIFFRFLSHKLRARKKKHTHTYFLVRTVCVCVCLDLFRLHYIVLKIPILHRLPFIFPSMIAFTSSFSILYSSSSSSSTSFILFAHFWMEMLNLVISHKNIHWRSHLRSLLLLFAATTALHCSTSRASWFFISFYCTFDSFLILHIWVCCFSIQFSICLYVSPLLAKNSLYVCSWLGFGLGLLIHLANATIHPHIWHFTHTHTKREEFDHCNDCLLLRIHSFIGLGYANA